MAERRVDPDDGMVYTYSEFVECYGNGYTQTTLDEYWSAMEGRKDEAETCAGSSECDTPWSTADHASDRLHTFALSPGLHAKTDGRIDAKYDVDLDCLLGQGSFGQVVKAFYRKNGEARAVKMIEKAFANPERLEFEIYVHSDLCHPYIVKLHEFFETVEVVNIVLECCEGGDLFERLQEDGWFEEVIAKKYMQQLLAAIDHLHSYCIAHRDLKLDNLMLESLAPDADIKLIDFGLAKEYEHGVSPNMWTTVGTVRYVSPEVLEGAYDETCDIWSCGVVCYAMLCGSPPFGGDTDDEVTRKVRKAHLEFASDEWDGISDSGHEFVQLMMRRHAASRLSAEILLQHRWFE